MIERPIGPSRNAAASATSSGSSSCFLARGASNTSSSTRPRDPVRRRLGGDLRLDQRRPHVARTERGDGDPAPCPSRASTLTSPSTPCFAATYPALNGEADKAVHRGDDQEPAVT